MNCLIVLYVVLCTGFAAGLYISEHGSRSDDSFWYIAGYLFFVSILAPFVFSALVAAFLYSHRSTEV